MQWASKRCYSTFLSFNYSDWKNLYRTFPVSKSFVLFCKNVHNFNFPTLSYSLFRNSEFSSQIYLNLLKFFKLMKTDVSSNIAKNSTLFIVENFCPAPRGWKKFLAKILILHLLKFWQVIFLAQSMIIAAGCSVTGRSTILSRRRKEFK